MLNDINTTDIPAAIRLGCETMQRIFNPDDGDLPYFDARVLPNEQVGFAFMAPFTEAHVPGRHLHALLNAHAVLNVPLDETAIDKHRKAAFYSFSGPVPFPLNRDRIGGTLLTYLDHNLREGLFALNALVRFRNDSEARQLADRCIDAIFEYWNPVTGWDRARLDALGLRFREQTFIYGPARAIGPLVAYHQTTGSTRSLELALILAEKALGSFFREDGFFDVKTFGSHTHSTTCTLSSLAQLAVLQKDARMLERVRGFYDRGLWQIRNEIGWVIESAGPDTLNPDRGEINNTGDIIETALILGANGNSNQSRFFHDAERTIRCHLLPAQLRDTSFIHEPDDPLRPDAKRDVARRMRGAFGFPAPYGHHPIGMTIVDFCLDIVGGAVSSLCEAWRAAVTTDAGGHHVNMLFDRADGDVRVESPYTHDHLRITLHRPAPLRIRIPPWVDRSELRVEGAIELTRWQDDHLVFLNQPAGRPISIRFHLPTEELTLKHRTRSIRVRLRGDEVLAMENHGASLTFFPTI